MDVSTNQVQKLYERRPYPHYPLFAKPQWQDGYLGSSLFAQALVGQKDLAPQGKFLSIGSGEMLPYIIRQWEPSSVQVTCVDLSKRSLDRAKIRTSFLGRRIEFVQDNINSFLQPLQNRKNSYGHIEAFGVLHHISTFQTTLNLISESMSNASVCRIMVYNAHARDWIWDINRAFKLLGIEFHSNQSIHSARKILTALKTLSPRFRQRLEQMGPSALNNDSRFADTFLHPWESRATIAQWFAAFAQSGLTPIALHDRYAELDDLKNPFWKCPTISELEERSRDLRFENNLEVWLTKGPDRPSAAGGNKPVQTTKIPLRLKMRKPTHRFNQFKETKGLSNRERSIIWNGFIQEIHNGQHAQSIQLISTLDLPIAQRLARIGLILPSQAKKASRYDELLKPMESDMSPPILAPKINSSDWLQVSKLCSHLQSDQMKLKFAVQRILRAL